MAVFLVIPIIIGLGYGVKKISDSYEANQKTKREKYDLKSKSLEAARNENKRLDERDKKIEELLESAKSKEKGLENQINDIKKELNDPSISKEKEAELRNQLAFIQTQLDEERKNTKKLNEEKEKNQKQREKNNETINKAGLNPDDKNWISDLVTFENAVILGSCYIAYKLLKDDK